MKGKRACRMCGWEGKKEKLLYASHPFRPGSIIAGCPDCLSTESLDITCDAPNCEKKATGGSPEMEGYRWFCVEHVPHRSNKP